MGGIRDRVVSKIHIAPLKHAIFSYVHGRTFPSTLTVNRTVLQEHVVAGGTVHRRFRTLSNEKGTTTVQTLTRIAKGARGNNRTCSLKIVVSRQFVRPTLRGRVICPFSLERHSQISFT